MTKKIDEWIGAAGEETVQTTSAAFRERRAKRAAAEEAAATTGDDAMDDHPPGDDEEREEEELDGQAGADEQREEPSPELEAPTAGAALPRGTSAMPWDDFERHGEAHTLQWLRDEVQRKQRLLAKFSREGPAERISVWWAAPGVAARDALPIVWIKELIERPFKNGTFYCRIRVTKGEESVGDEYYVARVPVDAAGASTADPVTTLQLAQGRALESLESTNKEQAKRIEQLTGENTRVRDELNELKDERAELERSVQGLEAEVAALKAKGEPLFDAQGTDMIGVQAIGAFTQYLQDPGKEARAYIDTQRNVMRQMWDAMEAFYADERVLVLVLREAPATYDALVSHCNAIAEACDLTTRFQTSAKLLPLLPPAEDPGDDHMLAALQEADQMNVELAEQNERSRATVARLKEQIAELLPSQRVSTKRAAAAKSTKRTTAKRAGKSTKRAAAKRTTAK